MDPRKPAKLGALAALLAAVTLLHYLTPTDHSEWHALYRWCYHVPIILAAFWFGLRGGVATGALVTGLYLPHVLVQWHGGGAEQWFEIALYNVVGWVTGLLSQRQKDEGNRYRRAAEELDTAYAELKERARVILETEEQLRRADRLSALGQLSAGLAHEIKTPLASIRGAAEILADSDDTAERREFADILVRESDRLNRVVNEFLDFARPREGPERTADLARAVSEVLSLVRVAGDRAHVTIEWAPPEDLPPVLVDPEQLRQVVLNLAMNAIQAMDEEGGTLAVTAVREGEAVRLVLADSGPGVDPAVRDRIFDPFFTTREGGTGLGLSIVQRILANFGATIDLASREAGGTAATIRFRSEEAGDG